MMSKSQLIERIAAEHDGLSKKDVKGVLESLMSVGHKELKKSGVFLLPGFANSLSSRSPRRKNVRGSIPLRKSRPYSRQNQREKSFGHAPLRQPRTPFKIPGGIASESVLGN